MGVHSGRKVQKRLCLLRSRFLNSWRIKECIALTSAHPSPPPLLPPAQLHSPSLTSCSPFGHLHRVSCHCARGAFSPRSVASPWCGPPSCRWVRCAFLWRRPRRQRGPHPSRWTKCSPFVPCSGKAPTNYGRTNYICAGYVRPCANFFFPSEFCPSPSLAILPLLPSRRLAVSLDLASGSQPDISSCTTPSLLLDVFCSP